MKVNLLAEIKRLNGSPFEIKDQDGKPTTFKQMLVNYAMYDFQDEKNDSEKKLYKYKLGKKIHLEESAVELTDAEVLLIKKSAARLLSTEAYGSFCEGLDG